MLVRRTLLRYSPVGDR